MEFNIIKGFMAKFTKGHFKRLVAVGLVGLVALLLIIRGIFLSRF
jgi:hypothetical protein